MKTQTLELAGPLQVPVDEFGCATGRPETLPVCPECGNPCAGTPDDEGFYDCSGPSGCGVFFRLPDVSRALALEHALRRLYTEAIYFRDRGTGREHLTNALIDARRVLEGGAL